VLSVRADSAILLLATDGTWRRVPPPSQGGYGAVLSADGTRLAVDTQTGVDAWDLPTGERTSVPFPSGYVPSESLEWAWVDDSTLLLDGANPAGGGWLVEAVSADATRVPYPGNALSWTVDADGAVVESTDYGTPAQLVDRAGDEPRRVDTAALGLGRLTSIRANGDTVVAVGGSAVLGGPAVVVIDRANLEPRHVLPLFNPGDNYGSGKAPVVAVLHDGTVLLQIPVYGSEFSWRVVAWDPQSGQLTRVSRGGSGSVPWSYASGVLG